MNKHTVRTSVVGKKVLLIVRSQYQYKVIGKIFQLSKAPSKIEILFCTHFSFKINLSLIQTARTTPEDQQRARVAD
jgi:hypothetical protein